MSDRRRNTRQGRPVYAALLLLLPVSMVLNFFCRKNPDLTEELYSRKIYPAIAHLSCLFGLFSFSVAEAVLFLLIAAVLWLVIRRFAIPKNRKKFSLADTGRFLLKAACVFCCTCFLFTIMWGLNYCRRPLERNLGYTVIAPNSKLLENMMEEQTEAVNRLCRKIVFRQSGSVYPGGFQKIKDRVSDGYIQLSEKIRFVRKTPVHPKALILSRLMSYTNISGIFIPFTYEPCVDLEYPEFVLAFNTAHECAHFQGFAKEDEANYIAYLANTENPDPYFQYSAHMMALIYVSNALAQTDRTASNTIFKKLDSRAMGDLRSFNNFGKLHESPFQAISDRINDSYLKLQGQKGIESYDGFVDLLAMGYDEKMR